MNSFLHQTARSIIETIEWKQLSNTTLVLPSHRAGLVLKDELLRLQQENHAQAVWAPDVKTLPQLQDFLSPLYAEDEFMTIVRLYKHYITSNPLTSNPLTLDMFYGWGRQMIADFTNIDASMPAEQVPNFFDNTIAAHELSQWQLDEEVEQRLRALINPQAEQITPEEQSVRVQYEHVWRQLYELYKALQSEMRAEQKGYTGMRQRAVIECWEDESVQAKIAGRTYIFVGFNYLLPVERELMQLLKEAGQARFYWDYVENFKTNEKAFSFTQLNSSILGSANQSQIINHKSQITVMSCASREAQAQYVHRWLKENYRAHGDKVGVVICDETMLEPVIYALPAITLPGETEPEPVNITKGFPLRNTQVYADVMRWLSDRARGDADTVVPPTIMDEMTAALWPTKEEDEEEPLTPNPLTSNPLSWQELLVLESEYQVRKIANQLRSVMTSGVEGVTFTLKLLRLLMRRAMEAVTMPFHGEPVTDIQIMGVLETRLLDFDRLLLLNVEEGIVPQRKQDSSFIPFYLRKAYHMQTADERATVYAYNFFRLLSRAGHATLMYASADTVSGGKGQSRFILQMMASDEFDVQKAVLQESSTLSEPLSTVNNQLSTIDSSLTRLSPSAINTYISCPRSFYWQYILKLRPKEEESVLFAANTLGSFVHNAMEFIYREYMHCDSKQPVRVTPEQIEAVRTDEEKLQKALLAAYEAMNIEWLKEHENEPNHYIPAHHTGENVLIIGFVKNILERDREDARVGLQIYQLEKKRTFHLTVDGRDIELGGVIDRLDIYGAEGQERLRVIDYKSGGYNESTHARKMSAKWEDLMESEDKGYVRQTLIYCNAVAQTEQTETPIEPHLYFCRHKLTDAETTIDVEGQRVAHYQDLAEPFLQSLQAKVQEILTATDFPQCEETKCPSFCPFFDLCGRKPPVQQ